MGTGLSPEALRDKYKDVLRHLKAGHSIRHVARITGKGISTVQRVERRWRCEYQGGVGPGGSVFSGSPSSARAVMMRAVRWPFSSVMSFNVCSKGTEVSMKSALMASVAAWILWWWGVSEDVEVGEGMVMDD